MTKTARRVIAIVAAIGLGVAAGGWFARDREVVATSVPVARPAVRSPAPAYAAVTSVAPRAAAPTADALRARYMDLRDDVDPLPRLAFIEDVARGTDSAAAADLLAQALVDPDERVRTRARALLDRTTSSEPR